MPFASRFAGTCAKCQKPINVGDLISWDRTQKRGNRTWHADCTAPSPTPGQIPDSTPGTKTPEILPPIPKMPEGSHPLAQGIVDAIMPILRDQFTPKDATINEDKLVDLIKRHATQRHVVEIKEPGKPDIEIPDGHKYLSELIAALNDGESVYLYGPAGTGKTHGAHQAFAALGLESEFISLNLQTSDTRLSGFIDANGTFRAPGFFNAYVHGKGMLIDEVDNASGNVLTALNSAIANGHASFPNGVYAKHPKFRLACTGNTVGRGASRTYSDRRQLDGAFLDRFYFINWDYDPALELSIALAINSEIAPIVEWLQNVRAFCAKEYPHFLVTPRASQRIGRALKRGRKLGDVLDAALWHGLETETVSRILKAHPAPKGF